MAQGLGNGQGKGQEVYQLIGAKDDSYQLGGEGGTI